MTEVELAQRRYDNAPRGQKTIAWVRLRDERLRQIQAETLPFLPLPDRSHKHG